MPGSIVFTGPGARDFEKFSNSKITMEILKEEVGKATLRNALLLQDEIKQSILKKKFKKNAKVTQAIKGENFPLKDTGDMLSAVETELKDSFNAFVGFLENSKTSHGGNLKKVVPLLEKGFEVRITPAMRRFLFAKAAEGGGDAGGPKKASSGVIRVPGRPFLQKAFKNKKNIRKMNRNWELAVRLALKRIKAL